MQTRLQSLIESLVNLAIGLGVSMTANAYILPLFFGRDIAAGENILLAIAYTIVSLIRSYLLRRCFNHWHSRSIIGQKV
jgi:uncharacterized membrane protein YgaE (UPF0421/DUF939 family)